MNINSDYIFIDISMWYIPHEIVSEVSKTNFLHPFMNIIFVQSQGNNTHLHENQYHQSKYSSLTVKMWMQMMKNQQSYVP